MRLVVKKAGETVNELQFKQGPINIGRHADSQVFLPSRTVSRHHAVIFAVNNGTWQVEDLASANKTFLNGAPITKAPITNGDTIEITDFVIEVNLEDNPTAEKTINLEDTLTTPIKHTPDETTAAGSLAGATLEMGAIEAQVIIRRVDMDRAADVSMPAKRIMDFLEASEAICAAGGLDEMLEALLRVLMKQFAPRRAWCAFRSLPQGPMLVHKGKHKAGTRVQLGDLSLKDKVDQVLEKPQFLLMPRIPPSREKEQIHSAMIAPVLSPRGCFGVIYIDNDLSHEHYSLSELDYLAFLAIHTAVVVENF